jgi:hypothetical protein
MGRLRLAAGPLLLAFLITGFYWRLVSRQYTWMDHPDMANQVIPWLDAEARSFHRGEFPLWDPNVYGGQPMLGQLQPGAAYPLNWILFALPLRNGHINLAWVQLNFVVTHILAAWFCFWLCRDLGCSFTAAMLGGAAFSLSGIAGWLSWPQFLNGAIWTPLILLFFLRFSRGERPVANAALSGAFMGMAFLSGHHQIPTFVALALAGLWIAELLRRGTSAMAPAAAFGLFFVLVGALQLLPAYEYGTRAVRWVGLADPVGWNQRVPYTVHDRFSTLPSGLLGLVLPNVRVEGVFVGAAVVILALAGAVEGFKRFAVRCFAGIAAGGVALALGSTSIFHGLAYWLAPMVDKARVPAMAILLTQFALAVLAAMGLDAIRRGGVDTARWPAVLTLLGGAAWAVVAIAATFRPEAEREYEHWAVFGMVTLSAAALLWLWRAARIGARGFGAMTILLVLFELGTFMVQSYIPREKPAGNLLQLDLHKEVIEFLKQQPDTLRVDVDGDTLPVNIGDWEDLETYHAYLASVTSNLMPVEASGAAPKILALTHYVGKKPARPSQQLVFEGQFGVNVYRDSEASPRVWIVHGAQQVAREALAGGLGAADLRRTALMTEAPPMLETCSSGDEARVTQRWAAGVTIEARLGCRGLVILSDVWFPGWEATVDGAPARIYETDGAIRGVVAAGGAHRIEMRYRPKSVYAGAFLTGLGLLGAVFLGLRRSR